MYLAGELLGHMITLCLTFKEMSDCFHDPNSPEGVRQFVIFLVTICGYGFWERIPELKCLLLTSYWEDIIPTWHDWVIGGVDLHHWFKVMFPSFSSAQYLLSLHLLHSRLTRKAGSNTCSIRAACSQSFEGTGPGLCNAWSFSLTNQVNDSVDRGRV